MQLASAVIYVDDGRVPETLDFYRRALGLALKFYDPDYQYGELVGDGAFVAVAAHATGSRLMPAYRPPPAGMRVANVELAFTVTDVGAAFSRAVAAGASVLASPYTLPWGQEVAYVQSPDGTILGLCAPLPTT